MSKTFHITGWLSRYQLKVDEYTTASTSAQAIKQITIRLEKKLGLAKGTLYTGELKAEPVFKIS